MKVVLYCGGQGLRLRDYSDNVPKPMVPVGSRPILWHMMKYYAHYGHRDFILCLGHKAETIKDYFLNYNECLSNDFVLTGGGRNLKLLSSDIDDWNITFVDTGIETGITQRLLMVRDYLKDESHFMVNYADSVSDLDLRWYVDHALNQDKLACFLSVRPSTSFHVVTSDNRGAVSGLKLAQEMDLWINGGYFVLKQEVFDYIKPGEELVLQPFDRLIAQNQLITHKHEGFWACMDTFKEKMQLDDMVSREKAPWMVWKKQRNLPARSA